MASGGKSVKNFGSPSPVGDDSSESEAETEPAKSFHRRLSTNHEIKCSVCQCEIAWKLVFSDPKQRCNEYFSLFWLRILVGVALDCKKLAESGSF